MKILEKDLAKSYIEMTKWDGSFLRPWDSLTFTESGAEYCSNYWKSFIKDFHDENDDIRSDVIMSGDISVYDMILETETNKEYGDVLYSRVILFPDLSERVFDITGELPVGIIILYTEKFKGFVPFKVSAKSDYIIFEDCIGLITDTDEEYQFYYENPDIIDESTIKQSLLYYMKLWYGVMITILNPLTVKIIKRETKPYEPSENPVQEKYYDNKLRYIRRKIINDTDFIEVLEHGKYNRRTPCWLVSGHRRDQPTKNGVKPIFIKPHWRGPLRELKDHKTRERELVYNKGDNN